VALNDDEIERYARHLVLPEIGGAGQAALKKARVLVIGAGGLGAPVLMYLAAAGVGHLGIIDDDVVSLSNLQRQVIHATSRIDRPKTDSARQALSDLNPHLSIETHNTRLTEDNAKALIAGNDLVIDGSDNFDTRYASADAAEAAEVPLITGAVGRCQRITSMAGRGPAGGRHRRMSDVDDDLLAHLDPQRPSIGRRSEHRGEHTIRRTVSVVPYAAAGPPCAGGSAQLAD
jgi:molybdopterin/thiamine biosynthesis adenylyltransferase